MQKWLVIYDIRDTKRLHRVAKIMEDYGQRVQKSVFEVEASERVIRRMRDRVKEVMHLEQDYVVYFSICEADWQKREKYGPGKYEDPPAPYHIY